eukprot:UC4_evm3s114
MTELWISPLNYKYHKLVVYVVEKFIHRCKSDHKVPALYVIDSIVRHSKHKHKEKDPFVPRFSKNLSLTFKNLTKCSADQEEKIKKVVKLWVKNNVFPEDLCNPMLAEPSDVTTITTNTPRSISASTSMASSSNTGVNSKEKDVELDAALDALLDDKFSYDDDDIADRVAQQRKRMAEEQQKEQQRALDTQITTPDAGVQELLNSLLSSSNSSSGLSALLGQVPVPASGPSLQVNESQMNQSSSSQVNNQTNQVPENSLSDNSDRVGSNVSKSKTSRSVRVLSTVIFVGNLSNETKKEDIFAFIGRFGPIRDVAHRPEKHCAFVQMWAREPAERAISMISGQTLKGREISVGWGKANVQRNASDWDSKTGVTYHFPEELVGDSKKNLYKFCMGCVVDRKTLDGMVLKNYEEAFTASRPQNARPPQLTMSRHPSVQPGTRMPTSQGEIRPQGLHPGRMMNFGSHSSLKRNNEVLEGKADRIAGEILNGGFNSGEPAQKKRMI